MSQSDIFTRRAEKLGKRHGALAMAAMSDDHE